MSDSRSTLQHQLIDFREKISLSNLVATLAADEKTENDMEYDRYSLNQLISLVDRIIKELNEAAMSNENNNTKPETNSFLVAKYTDQLSHFAALLTYPKLKIQHPKLKKLVNEFLNFADHARVTTYQRNLILINEFLYGELQEELEELQQNTSSIKEHEVLCMMASDEIETYKRLGPIYLKELGEGFAQIVQQASANGHGEPFFSYQRRRNAEDSVEVDLQKVEQALLLDNDPILASMKLIHGSVIQIEKLATLSLQDNLSDLLNKVTHSHLSEELTDQFEESEAKNDATESIQRDRDILQQLIQELQKIILTLNNTDKVMHDDQDTYRRIAQVSALLTHPSTVATNERLKDFIAELNSYADPEEVKSYKYNLDTPAGSALLKQAALTPHSQTNRASSENKALSTSYSLTNEEIARYWQIDSTYLTTSQKRLLEQLSKNVMKKVFNKSLYLWKLREAGVKESPCNLLFLERNFASETEAEKEAQRMAAHFHQKIGSLIPANIFIVFSDDDATFKLGLNLDNYSKLRGVLDKSPKEVSHIVKQDFDWASNFIWREDATGNVLLSQPVPYPDDIISLMTVQSLRAGLLPVEGLFSIREEIVAGVNVKTIAVNLQKLNEAMHLPKQMGESYLSSEALNSVVLNHLQGLHQVEQNGQVAPWHIEHDSHTVYQQAIYSSEEDAKLAIKKFKQLDADIGLSSPEINPYTPHRIRDNQWQVYINFDLYKQLIAPMVHSPKPNMELIQNTLAKIEQQDTEVKHSSLPQLGRFSSMADSRHTLQTTISQLPNENIAKNIFTHFAPWTLRKVAEQHDAPYQLLLKHDFVSEDDVQQIKHQMFSVLKQKYPDKDVSSLFVIYSDSHSSLFNLGVDISIYQTRFGISPQSPEETSLLIKKDFAAVGIAFNWQQDVTGSVLLSQPVHHAENIISLLTLQSLRSGLLPVPGLFSIQKETLTSGEVITKIAVNLQKIDESIHKPLETGEDFLVSKEVESVVLSHVQSLHQAKLPNGYTPPWHMSADRSQTFQKIAYPRDVALQAITQMKYLDADMGLFSNEGDADPYSIRLKRTNPATYTIHIDLACYKKLLAPKTNFPLISQKLVHDTLVHAKQLANPSDFLRQSAFDLSKKIDDAQLLTRIESERCTEEKGDSGTQKADHHYFILINLLDLLKEITEQSTWDAPFYEKCIDGISRFIALVKTSPPIEDATLSRLIDQFSQHADSNLVTIYEKNTIALRTVKSLRASLLAADGFGLEKEEQDSQLMSVIENHIQNFHVMVDKLGQKTTWQKKADTFLYQPTATFDIAVDMVKQMEKRDADIGLSSSIIHPYTIRKNHHNKYEIRINLARYKKLFASAEDPTLASTHPKQLAAQPKAVPASTEHSIVAEEKYSSASLNTMEVVNILSSPVKGNVQGPPSAQATVDTSAQKVAIAADVEKLLGWLKIQMDAIEKDLPKGHLRFFSETASLIRHVNDIFRSNKSCSIQLNDITCLLLKRVRKFIKDYPKTFTEELAKTKKHHGARMITGVLQNFYNLVKRHEQFSTQKEAITESCLLKKDLPKSDLAQYPNLSKTIQQSLNPLSLMPTKTI